MNVFSAKSIGLYSIAIGSAIGFFHLVTSYGEANIKAPIVVDGNYLIASQNLPGCLQGKALLFGIQQSGIYLNANLSTTDILENTYRSATTSSPNTRPTFSGRLRDRQLDLSGSIPTTSCIVPSQLRITASIVDRNSATDSDPPKQGLSQRQLQGKLWLTSKDNPQGSPIDFTAILQPLTSPQSSSKKSNQSH
jgi:hypothetical protein